jgi:hypothetical protein
MERNHLKGLGALAGEFATLVISPWCSPYYRPSVMGYRPLASLTGGTQFVTVNQSFTNLD